MTRPSITLALIAALALAACDSTPGDPLDPRTDVASLLRGSTHASAAGLSLPGLLHAAVHRVYVERGAGAAADIVAELRRLQEAQATLPGDAPAAVRDARLQATRAEELRIVLSVFGEPIVHRVIGTVAEQLGELREPGADAGANAPAAAAIAVLLARAQRAADAGQWAVALDAATRAASAAEAARLEAAAPQRVPGLDELFGEAVARLEAGGGAAALARYERLREAAVHGVSGSDRQRVHEALRAVRDEQIRVVLGVLGDAAPGRVIDGASAAQAALDAALHRARAGGADVSRTERMAAGAADLLNRAAAARAAGDTALALDLASHAAGLIDAARASLSR